MEERLALELNRVHRCVRGREYDGDIYAPGVVHVDLELPSDGVIGLAGVLKALTRARLGPSPPTLLSSGMIFR